MHHGYFHKPYQETIFIKRTGAMGDVIMVEPILHHFYKKGCRVVLDTLPQFSNLFIQHYFKIHRPEELDGRIKYDKEYNLDLAYESTPKQLHLKSYYDFCEVAEEEREYINPRLNLNFDVKKDGKLFEKYVIICIDERNEPHRNIYGVNWKSVCMVLKNRGYDVIQLGNGEHEFIEGAILMNTPSEPFLMWAIGSADLYIGIDSGISHIASAFNIQSIILFGSVNPEIIHPDKNNKIYIHNHDKNVCNTPFCWNSALSTSGQPCVVNEKQPPCTIFETKQVVDAINRLI